MPWVRRLRLGSGLMGEQGAESILAHIMKLERIHQGIPDDVERLRYIMKEHMLKSDPSLTCLIPAPKKREKKKKKRLMTPQKMIVVAVTLILDLF